MKKGRLFFVFLYCLFVFMCIFGLFSYFLSPTYLPTHLPTHSSVSVTIASSSSPHNSCSISTIL